MASPDSKRTTRPASDLTTADIYGARHGIPDDVQAALQNVGRRNRQVVSMGRPLVPTQSLPAFTSPHFSSHNLQNNFMTERDTYRRAESIINKEQWRQHEIQPYAAGGAVDALDLAPSGPERRLRFEPSGEVVLERGTKRNGEEDADTIPVIPVKPTNAAEFNAMPPPPLPSRTTRALPRTFNKTVSAPVGRLGTWSGMEIDPATGSAGFGAPAPVAAPFTSGFGGFSPATSFSAPQEASEEEEDGFDVSEWAASEQF